MDTIRLNKPGEFQLLDTTEPEAPAAGMALVRVRHVGLCGTDINAYRGIQPFFEYPRILGHELGVEIEALGEGCGDLAVGMRCSVEPYLSQPGGRAYARGKTNCAANTVCLGVHCDGGMRERIVVPADKLHPSARLSTEHLALVETLCIGHHAVERAALLGDEVLAVVGLGPIGLGVASFAKLQGARVVCVDIAASRLEKAEQLIPGVETLLLTAGMPLGEAWAAAFGEAPEVVFDCTGNKHSMEASIEFPCHGGRVVFVGIHDGELSFSDPSFHKRELTLMSSRNARAQNFREVIALLEEGAMDVEAWITHRCPAAAFPEQITGWLAKDSGILKGVLSF